MSDLHNIYTRFPANFPLPFILDGSTGTALMREGMPRGTCTESWVIDNPQILQKIQRSYAASGSDAVLAPSFGANRPSLLRHGIFTPAGELNTELSAISCGIARFTGGDISPTGLFMEPYGDSTFEEVVSVYAEQAQGLHSTVDFFIIETMISLAEARAAVTGIKSVTDKPVFVTLTVDKNGRTISGDTLDASFLTLAALDIAAFGCNCSVGPADMLEVLIPLKPLSVALGLPLIAKPNAGMPHECPDGSQYFDLSAQDFGKFIPSFIENSIYVLGGCCGTDDGHISEIKQHSSCVHKPDITPADLSFVACTNKVTAVYQEGCEKIAVTDDITDDILDSVYEVPLIELNSVPDAETVLANAYMFERPFALCGDTEAVALVLRRYNGRPYVI